MRSRPHFALIACGLLAWSICRSQSILSSSPRVIELSADRDSRYRQGHRASRTIEVFAARRSFCASLQCGPKKWRGMVAYTV